MTNLPFKIYEVGNLAAVPANIFVGKTFISDNGSNTRTKENCYSTFLFASIVGGKNIRVDQATEKDPYIFIDAKFFNFKPFNYYIDSLNGISNSVLENKYDPDSKLEYKDTIIENITQDNSGDVLFMIKTLGSNGNLTIADSGKELELRAGLYKAENIDFPEKVPLYTHTSKDINNNNIFHINKLIEGDGVLFEQILEFDWYSVINLFSSSSSLSSLSSVSISSSSTSESSSSISSSSMSSQSSISDQSSQSEECCVDCCADCQVYDVDFEVGEGSGAFIDFAEVWRTFDRYSWGTDGGDHGDNGPSQWKVTAEQHLNGGPTFRAPIAYTPRNDSMSGGGTNTLAAAWIVQNFPGNDFYISKFGNESGTASNPHYIDATTIGYSQTFNYQNGDADGWTYFHVDGAINVSLETSDTTDTLMEVYLNPDFTGLIGTYDFVRESDGTTVTFTDKAKLDFTTNGTYFVRICEFNTYQNGVSAPNSNFTLFAVNEDFPSFQPRIKTDLNPPLATAMVSPQSNMFNSYRFSIVLSANENRGDNDLIGFILATWEDENDIVVDPYTGESHPRMHTLSAIRIFTTQGFIATNPVWCIIYDINQDTEQIIARDDTPDTGLGPQGNNTWFDYPNGTRITVEKNGSVYTARCTDLADNPDNLGSLGYQLIVDTSNGQVTTFPNGIETTVTSPFVSELAPFSGATKTGFVVMSNVFSTFTLNSCEVQIDAAFDDTCQLCEPDAKTIAENRVTALARISCVDQGDSREGVVRFPENLYRPAVNDNGEDIAYFQYIGTESIDAENAIARYRLFQIFDGSEGNKVTAMSLFKFPELTTHTVSINSSNYNLINGITTNINSNDLPDDCNIQVSGETPEAFWTGFLDNIMNFDIQMDRSGISGDTDTYSFRDTNVFIWDKTFNIDSNNRKVQFKIIDPKQNNKQVGSLSFTVTECVSTDVAQSFGDLLVYLRSCNCGPIFQSEESMSSSSSSSSTSSESSSSSSSSSSCIEFLECLKPDNMEALVDISGSVTPLSGSNLVINDGISQFDIIIPRVVEDGIQYDPNNLFVSGTPWGPDECTSSSSYSYEQLTDVIGVSMVRINEHRWRIFIGDCFEQTLFFRWNLLKKGDCSVDQIKFENEFINTPPIEILCPSSSSSSSTSSGCDDCVFGYNDLNFPILEDVGFPGELILRFETDTLGIFNGFFLQCNSGYTLPSIGNGFNEVSVSGFVTIGGVDYPIDDGSAGSLSYMQAIIPCSVFDTETTGTITYSATYNGPDGCSYSDGVTAFLFNLPDINDFGINQAAYESACV